MIHLQLYSPPICPRDQNPKSIGRFEPSPWSPLVGAPFQGFAFFGSPKIRHISPIDSPSSGLSNCPLGYSKTNLQQIPDLPRDQQVLALVGRGSYHYITIHDLRSELGGIGFKIYKNHPQWDGLYTIIYTVLPLLGLPFRCCLYGP